MEDEAEEPVRRGRSPWTWPLIALIVLVVFVLGALLLNSLGVFSPRPTTSDSATTSSSTSTSASPTTTSSTPTTPSSTPTTPSPSPDDTVTIYPDRYRGQQFSTVQAQLINLGLTVKANEVFDASTPAGIVTSVDPTGVVKKGSEVTVTYSKGPETIAVPSFTSQTTVEQYRSTLRGLGLTAAGATTGLVSDVSPGVGSQVAKGSTVTIVAAQTTPATPPSGNSGG